MKVQAKFWVKSIQHHHVGAPGEIYAEVKLAPVYGDGPNAQWSKATPQGEISMSITNREAADAFELGKEYLVEFTPV